MKSWLRKTKAIFPSLLACLCVADTSFLTSSIFLAPVTLNFTSDIFLTLYTIFDGLSHISLSCSVFFTVAITIERYKVSIFLSSLCRTFFKAVSLAHNYNYRNARLGHGFLLLCYVLPVTSLSILLNIPKVKVVQYRVRLIREYSRKAYTTFAGVLPQKW